MMRNFTGADAALDAAYADAQSARVSVVAETVKTYLELRGAQQRLALLEGVANDAQRRGDLVATRVRLRMAGPSAENGALSRCDGTTCMTSPARMYSLMRAMAAA